jgi:hypothetical protein
MPARLNGAAYNDFLINELPELMENVPLNVRQGMWYQQDGAPSHNLQRVRQTLTEKFPERYASFHLILFGIHFFLKFKTYNKFRKLN